jgi:hypothetical protein
VNLALTLNFRELQDRFYEDLYGQMHNHIKQLMSDSTTRFQALLYRIDVSQREIDSYHRQAPEANYNDILTELIIHREIKKVMVRDYFRSHTKQKPVEDDFPSHKKKRRKKKEL